MIDSNGTGLNLNQLNDTNSGLLALVDNFVTLEAASSRLGQTLRGLEDLMRQGARLTATGNSVLSFFRQTVQEISHAGRVAAQLKAVQLGAGAGQEDKRVAVALVLCGRSVEQSIGKACVSLLALRVGCASTARGNPAKKTAHATSLPVARKGQGQAALPRVKQRPPSLTKKASQRPPLPARHPKTPHLAGKSSPGGLFGAGVPRAGKPQGPSGAGLTQGVAALGKGMVSGGEKIIALGQRVTQTGRDIAATGAVVVAVGKDTVQSGKQLVAAGKEISAFGSKVVQTGNQVGKVGESLTGVGDQTSRLGGRVTALGGMLEQCGGNAGKVGRFISDLGGDISEAGGKIVTMGRKVTGFGRDMAEAGQKVISLGKEVTQAGKTMIELGRKVIDIGKQFGKLGGAVSKMGGHIGGLGKCVKEGGELVIKFSGRIAEIGKKFTGLGGHAQELAKRVEALSGKLLKTIMPALKELISLASRLASRAISSLLEGVSKGFKLASGALKLLGGGVQTFGKALLLNPIGLAIAAIAAAVYLLWSNWDTIGPKIKAIWTGITDFISNAISKVKGFFGIGDSEVKRPQVTPPATKPVTQVHTQIHIDSRPVAEAVSRHQAREMGKPAASTRGFDPRLGAPHPA